MHILYIIGQSSGGLPHYTAELANAVAKRADVTVLKPTNTTADELFDDEVDVIEAFTPINVSMPKLYSFDVNPIDVVRGLHSYTALKRIREIDADIVHDTTDLFPQVKFFTKYHGIDDYRPFVVTRHEVSIRRFSISRPPVLAEELINFAIPDVNYSRMVVHTKNQKRALVDRGEDPENISVIPHGAYSVFGTHEDVDFEPEPNTLLFFGHIVPPKGFDTLIKAIPHVKEEIPDVKLILAGEGTIPKKPSAIIDRHSENFELHNEYVPNEEVKDLFGRAEVAVMPYRSQEGTKGHSGALATAFSFGKPVIASTAGEFEEQVADSGAGVVVPPDDPKRLAAAITRVLRDEQAKAEMAANSRRMAERLSWGSVAEQYLDVYESIVGSEPSKRMLAADGGDDDRT